MASSFALVDLLVDFVASYFLTNPLSHTFSGRFNGAVVKLKISLDASEFSCPADPLTRRYQYRPTREFIKINLLVNLISGCVGIHAVAMLIPGLCAIIDDDRRQTAAGHIVQKTAASTVDRCHCRRLQRHFDIL